MKTLFIIFGVFAIGFANAKPTIEAEIDTLTELRDTVEETVKDVVKASFSKAPAVSVMLNNSIGTFFKRYIHIFTFCTEVCLHFISVKNIFIVATLEILPTISDMDWEANLNDTEDSFKVCTYIIKFQFDEKKLFLFFTFYIRLRK